MSQLITGSICLSNIPKEVIKKIECKDGVTRAFVNIAIFERREPITFGDRTYTHSVSCAPKKEERVDGVNYYIGDLSSREVGEQKQPTPEQIDQAQAIADDDDLLPF